MNPVLGPTMEDLKRLWISANTPVVYAGPTEKFDHQNALEDSFDSFVTLFVGVQSALAVNQAGHDAVFHGIPGLRSEASPAERELAVQRWLYSRSRSILREATP